MLGYSAKDSNELCLYANLICPYSQRIVLALEALEINYIHNEIDFVLKPEQFENISPFGKVPLVKVKSFYLFGSMSILTYVNTQYQNALMPYDIEKNALLHSWSVAIDDIHRSLRAVFTEKDTITFNECIKMFRKQLEILWQSPLNIKKDSFDLLDIYAAPLLVLTSAIEMLGEINLIPDEFRDLLSHYESILPISTIDNPRYRKEIRLFLIENNSALHQQFKAMNC